MTSCQKKSTAALNKRWKSMGYWALLLAPRENAFIIDCCSPVDLAFNQGMSSNHCHGDRSTCELSHCAAPVRQKETTIIREKRWYHLLLQVRRCTAQSAVRFFLESCSILAGLAWWPRQGREPRASTCGRGWDLMQDCRSLPALFTGSSGQAELVFIFCAFKSYVHFMKLKYWLDFPCSYGTITMAKTLYSQMYFLL